MKPNCDSLQNLNVYKDVVMKGRPEEIPDRSVYGLSIDVSHIKCDFFKTGRSLGVINMRHMYAIRSWKTHLGTAENKEVILDCEERERR